MFSQRKKSKPTHAFSFRAEYSFVFVQELRSGEPSNSYQILTFWELSTSALLNCPFSAALSGWLHQALSLGRLPFANGAP